MFLLSGTFAIHLVSDNVFNNPEEFDVIVSMKRIECYIQLRRQPKRWLDEIRCNIRDIIFMVRQLGSHTWFTHHCHGT